MFALSVLLALFVCRACDPLLALLSSLLLILWISWICFVAVLYALACHVLFVHIGSL